MLTTLLLGLVLALTHDHEADPAARQAVPAEGFDVSLRGALDSRIHVHFRAVPGKRVQANLRSPEGGSVKIDGWLRSKPMSGYTLEIALEEKAGAEPVKKRTFTTDLVPGKKTLFCCGWVWWYEVALNEPRPR